MKKVYSLFCVSITTFLFSCSHTDSNLINSVPPANVNYAKELLVNAQNIIIQEEKNADKISSYFNQDWGDCNNSDNETKAALYREQKMQKYLEKHNLTENQLYDYLENNPSGLIPFVEEVSSSKFSQYYSSIPFSDFDSLLKDIYNDYKLSSLEKAMLFLLIGSEYNIREAQTKSFWSCVKRYTKLTTISVKATAISIIDMQSGVEYATRELNKMGNEYDC